MTLLLSNIIRLGVFIIMTTALLHAAAPASPPLAPGVRSEHVMIPMRDGQRLSAYLYFPDGKGPWAPVFEQRYADISNAGTRKTASELAQRGFVVAMVNYRGTHESEGTWVGYRALGWGELQDGYDICEWLAKQTWSTGMVGTFGSSQGGFAQNFLAVTQPPHLVCQYMVDTGLSLFQEGYRIGGITRPNRFLELGSNCRNPDDNLALLREWDRHPNYDDYWRAEDCSLHFDKMNVPCFTIGSWYDFMVQGSIKSFAGRQHHGGPQSRGRQQLAIGPWLHGRLNKGSKIAEMTYPDNATWPELDHMTRWFNHWLKGEANGIDQEPPVRYYVMGAVGEQGAPGNTWRDAKDWPPPANATSFHLHDNGQLKATAPSSSASSTTYASDPRQPMAMPGRSFLGAKDARSFEEQSEVRSWTMAQLEQPLEITGEVTAEIWVSSTAADTDFILRISDVYPDGKSMLLMDYPMRARYREGFDKQVLLEPNKPAKLAWHIGWTSIILDRGHRLRVTIASSGAPLYEPNNQTGSPQTIDWMKETKPALNTIWHDQSHPSRVLLPVAK